MQPGRGARHHADAARLAADSQPLVYAHSRKHRAVALGFERRRPRIARQRRSRQFRRLGALLNFRRRSRLRSRVQRLLVASQLRQRLSALVAQLLADVARRRSSRRSPSPVAMPPRCFVSFGKPRPPQIGSFFVYCRRPSLPIFACSIQLHFLLPFRGRQLTIFAHRIARFCTLVVGAMNKSDRKRGDRARFCVQFINLLLNALLFRGHDYDDDERREPHFLAAMRAAEPSAASLGNAAAKDRARSLAKLRRVITRLRRAKFAPDSSTRRRHLRRFLCARAFLSAGSRQPAATAATANCESKRPTFALVLRAAIRHSATLVVNVSMRSSLVAVTQVADVFAPPCASSAAARPIMSARSLLASRIASLVLAQRAYARARARATKAESRDDRRCDDATTRAEAAANASARSCRRRFAPLGQSALVAAVAAACARERVSRLQRR